MGEVVTRKQLEEITTQAFEALKKTILSKEQKSALRAQELYTTSFKRMQGYLKDPYFLRMNQRRKVTPKINRFALQIAIAKQAADELAHQRLEEHHVYFDKKGKPHEYSRATLRRALYDRKKSYFDIAAIAWMLARVHNYEAILDVLEHVREKY